MALRSTQPAAGPRLLSSWATPFQLLPCQFSPPSFPSSSSLSCAFGRGCAMKTHCAVLEEDMEPLTEVSSEIEVSAPSLLTPEHKALLVLVLSLGFAFGSAEAAIALGPEGPLVEEFWDNMRRYGLFFLTTFTGGLYSLVEPIFSLLRNPFTAIFTIAFLLGSFYLLYLVLNTMLGITSFNYEYS